MHKNRFFFALQLATTLTVCAFLVIPVVQSVLAGFTANFFKGLESGFTIKWVIEVWRLYADTIYRSLYIAVACLALTLLLGIPAAYVLVKRSNRWTRMIEELLVLPIAVPGLAIAMGILLMYGTWGSFRSSWLFILAGHVLFTLPFMIRSVMAVMASINMKELEEGAASLGATFRQRFVTIIVPNAASGILAGSLMVLTLSVGEFNITWMLHTPLTKTLPVGLADSYASMRLEIGSAYTIVFFAMIIPLLLAMQRWMNPVRREGNAAAKTTRKDVMSTSPPVPAAVMEPGLQTGVRVRLERCAKTFDDGSVGLDPLDLDIQAGETVVILGPSGCGKTTTLRIIAGLESPDPGGRVLFGDEDVTRIPIEKRNVGMVFQSYALFPNMNVAQNIGYGLRLRKMGAAEIRRRVAEVMATVRIEELASRHVDQLSGGQRQRVALARALAVRPRVLLLDEPLTALDAKLRESLREEIGELLASQGVTSIYVTHDQSEAMALGDRIVVMDKGCVVQTGSPRDIYFSPCSRFVAEFIGTINTLTCPTDGANVLFENGAVQNPTAAPLPDAVEVFFRPEQAYLAENGDGLFEARVESCSFLGDKSRLVLRNGNNDRIVVDTKGSTRFVPGERVPVGVNRESLFLL